MTAMSPIASVSSWTRRRTVVLASAVLDHVGVQLVGHRRELAHRTVGAFPRPRAAASPQASPTSAPPRPAHGVGEVLHQRQQQEHGGADRRPRSGRTPRWGRARRPASRITSHAPITPERDPVAAGGDREAVAERVVEPAAASMPSEPQATSRINAVGTMPSRRSTLGQEERHGQADHEQVADVVVDERRGEVAPALVADRRRRSRPGRRRSARRRAGRS